MNRKQKVMLSRIIISFTLLVILNFVPARGYTKTLLFLIPYLVIGYDILRKAILGLFNGSLLDENFLMALATVGAFIIAISSTGDYNEAVAVMLFYQIGELFQSYAVGKSRKSISALMDIRPDYANLEKDGKIEKVDPDTVPVGSIIVVRPGEKIPIDGKIIEGKSSLNLSALTGESIPADVKEGDEVTSGSVNMTGLLRIETEKEFGESTVSKILDLVENASSRKSKSEAFITKFARIYTPAVTVSAILLALIPPIANILILESDPQWMTWIYRALTFLVISCPCALVISIPLSFFAGIGGASKEGILIKGSNFLEALSKVRTIVFDKTGTLTKGVFIVNGIHHSTIENERLLEYAAYAESASSHPIARSIISYYGKDIDEKRIGKIEEFGGNGVIAIVDGHEVACGNSKLMDKISTPYINCHSIGTIVHVAIDRKYAGHILISDVIKPTSKEAIRNLKKVGVEKTVMLTGDREEVASKVASDLGLDEYYSQLLPADKVDKVETLMEKKEGLLAFAGDGVNDAPVLSRSDIGIAMGALGSDAAIEASDVVLMDDDPQKIPKAIKIAKKCMRIVYENIVFAIAVKFICLILGAFGIANMWLAIFADVGVMVIAVINSIRALMVKDL